jgi:Tol biopolymer transport system component
MLIGACLVGAAGLAIAGTAVPSRQAGPAGLIVFTKEGGAYGDGQLFTIRPDGTGLHQITRGPTNSVNADWSPDGTTLAFSHYLPSSALVSLMNADGTDVRAVTPDGFQDAPSFAPDGKALVYTRDPSPSQDGLWLIDINGADLRQLTANPFIHNGECGCDGAAKISPDGTTVAFVRIKRDNVSNALFSVHVDGSGLRPLLPYSLVIGNHLDWSPDGKRIAVTIGANALPGRSANVATVDPNGKNLRWVTRFKGGKQDAFVGGYSPDGKWLVIRLDQGVTHGLYLVHPDGTARHRIYVSRDVERGIDWGKGTS